MACVYRPKGRKKWYIAYVDPTTRRRVTVPGYRDESATRAMATDLERRAARRAAGIEPQAPAKSVRLPPLVAEYLKQLETRSAMWREIVEKRLDKVLPTWSEQLSTTCIDSLGVKPQTWNQYRDLLTRFCDWLVKRGTIGSNPFAGIKRRKNAKRRLRGAFNQEQLTRLLATPRGSVYQFAVYSGLRRGEVAVLRWEWIDESGLWLPESKNGDEVRLPLHPVLVDWCRKHRGSGLVFPVMPRAETVNRDVAAAGVTSPDARGRHYDFHSLRYTTATLLIQAGVPLTVVQKILRHSDPKLTASLYTDIHADTIADALAKVAIVASTR